MKLMLETEGYNDFQPNEFWVERGWGMRSKFASRKIHTRSGCFSKYDAEIFFPYFIRPTDVRNISINTYL